MLQSKKHVFWEALIMTVAIFVIGIFLGILFESHNANEITQLSIQSEIGLTDASILRNLLVEGELSCEQAKETSINFANSVYEEAQLLEQFEAQGRLTNNLKLLHKKYDLIRTILWIGATETLEDCNNFDLVIYLYEYETEDLQIKATQNVWAKILSDLKEEHEDMLLIPIATDQDIASLDALLDIYGVNGSPAIIINNKNILYEISDASTIEAYFTY